jgi:hypothetical protein
VAWWALRVLLVLALLGYAKALHTIAYEREEFLRAFTAFRPEQWPWAYAQITLGVVAVFGLWLWQRWAIALFALLAVAGIAFDVWWAAPRAHFIAACVLPVLVGAAAWPLRARFR